MEKKLNKKVLFPVLAIIVILLLLLVWMLFGRNTDVTDYDISLNQRDVAIEKGEEVQLQIVPNKEKYENLDVDITWISSNPEVATVDEDGTVTGKDGGETKITVIVLYDGKEYSASCIVTIKDSDEQYSLYKVRWFTQSKDRGTYDVKEEVFERLVGSEVELSEKDASANLPSQYVLNKEKSVLKGTVKENKSACVLEVYYDVAEVTYSVNYYFESEELGIYKLGETKKYKAYAFTEVEAPSADKKGFVLDSSVKGSVLKKAELTMGSKLNAYYSRIRSKVTISYLDGRKDATYTNVYGIGLLDAPVNALKESSSLLFPITTYLNGKKQTVTAETLKSLTSDAKVAFQVEGEGFTYLTADGGTLLNTSEEKAKASYAYLKGSSDVIYLSATYTTTGSKDNVFGVSIRNGKESREIRFQSLGVAVTKNHTQEGGTLNAEMPVYYYNFAGRDGTTCVFAQNAFGTLGTTTNSEIQNMISNTMGGSYDIVWAVWEGTLYGSLDGVTIVRLPLNLLNASWTADKKYEIGFSSFDGVDAGDELKITNIDVSFGEEAEKKLITDQEITYSEKYRVDYEPLTGAYIPASINGASYIYGTESKENSGISTNLKWVDAQNTAARVGITVKVGDKTEQFGIDGTRNVIYHDTNYTWGAAAITDQVLKYANTFDKNGNCQVTAVVKDGNFYIQFNGKQALCIKMHALFPGYTKDSQVSVGVYTYNACVGQSHFQDMKVLSVTEVDKLALTEWRYYSELLSIDDYSFADGSAMKTTTGNTSTKNVTLYGQSDAWQIEGIMKRTDTSYDKNLIMGFAVQSGDKEVWIGGMTNGFVKVVNGQWGAVGDTSATLHAVGVDTYAVNDKVIAFFGAANGTKKRTLDETEFKVAIYDDVFYAWFDGELCWRVPLEEVQFGGFAEGSEYKVTLRIAEDADTAVRTGGFDDLQVKMGYEVTEQENFAKTLATIDKNVTRWDSFVAKRLTGGFAENVDELYTYAWTGKPYAYLKEASTDIYLSATFNQKADQSEGYGITILQGTESRQIEFLNEGVQIRANRTDSITGAPGIADGKVNTFAFSFEAAPGYGYKDHFWAQNISGTDGTTKNIAISKMTRTADGKTSYKVVWAITDGILYGSLDGQPFMQMPLTMLCADWTAEKEYRIGFSCIDNYAAKMKVTDIVDLYGDEAKAKLVTDKKVTAAETSQFSYEALTGSYMPSSSDGAKYLYGAATTENQAVKTTIQLVDKANTASWNGITVKAGNETAQVVVQGAGRNVKLLLNQATANAHDVTAKILSEASTYNDKGVCQMTAVVKNATLYVLCNDVQVGAISLNKILTEYKSGDSVQLGIFAYDSSKGSAKYQDVQFVTGVDAEGIAVKDTPAWSDLKFFTSEIYQANVDHVNGKINNVANRGTLVRFRGESDKWEVSGKMTRTDEITAKKQLLLGFNVMSGTKTLRATTYYQGIRFQKIENGSVKASTDGYRHGANIMAFNPAIGDFFKASPFERTKNEIYFKVVIVNDTLYVWFGDSESNLIESWKVPLNEAIMDYDNSSQTYSSTEIFDGFADGSKYNFGFYIDGAVEGQISNLTVKMGNGVDTTGISAFPKFFTSQEYRATVNKVAGTASNIGQNLETLIRFQGNSNRWEVSGTMARTDAIADKKELLLGFNIQESGKVLRAITYYQGFRLVDNENGSYVDNNNFRHGENELAFNTKVGDYFKASPFQRTKNTVSFKAVIANDVLYVWFGDDANSLIPSWKIPLSSSIKDWDNTNKKYLSTEVFAGFTSGSAYNLGIYIPGSQEIGNISNLTVKMGNAVDITCLSDFN
ncbi:MAG: Ig-like domain-containing protein [Tyzzerella sp.]|nr:Ig-like domain-containing protein [Tyzzerella sp.]